MATELDFLEERCGLFHQHHFLHPAEVLTRQADKIGTALEGTAIQLYGLEGIRLWRALVEYRNLLAQSIEQRHGNGLFFGNRKGKGGLRIKRVWIRWIHDECTRNLDRYGNLFAVFYATVFVHALEAEIM